MNRDALAVLIVFGAIAALLYSRQSQASYAPAGYVPAGESWTPSAALNPFTDLAATVENVFTEILSPLDQPSTVPVTVDTPIEQLPTFANPIPNLPAM